MNASATVTTTGDWMLKVLLILSGPGNVYENENQAIRDANYDILRECWDENLDQYDAAAYYRFARRGGKMKVREWFQTREKNLAAERQKHNSVPEPCRMFSGMPERMVKISTCRIVVIVGAVLGGLIGWMLRGAL